MRAAETRPSGGGQGPGAAAGGALSWTDRLWYERHPLALALAPLGWIFCTGAWLRRWLYLSGARRAERLPVPVVVVGNITAGGTGKTPLVVWIARFLRDHGFRPGVIARGYRGSSPNWPRVVTPESDPVLVGDEPVVIARRAACPVVAGPDRVKSARAVMTTGGCNVVVSDDGLQALALARIAEVAVLDGDRRFGNGRCLPAGPLRERPSRLRTVDLVVARGRAQRGEYAMTYRPGRLRNVVDDRTEVEPEGLARRAVHAVAGIGNPAAFFGQLRTLGLAPIEHRFADHHGYAPADLDFGDDLPVVMTEKDAVKCRGFASERTWYLPVEAVLEPGFGEHLLTLLGRGVPDGQQAS